MALDGAKFICLSDAAAADASETASPLAEDAVRAEAGNIAGKSVDAVLTGNAKVIDAKGRKFTVGYYMNCDYVLEDQRAEGVHCEIQCDAFGRVTIHNISEKYPISVNEQTITLKRPLLDGSRIKILDKYFLWKFPKSVEVTETSGNNGGTEMANADDDTATPQKVIVVPEQAPNSCPDLKPHRKMDKRFTVHNFAYCINSDEEGNTSAELPNTATSDTETKDDGEEKASTINKPEGANKKDESTTETGVITGEMSATKKDTVAADGGKAAANSERRSITPPPNSSSTTANIIASTPLLRLEDTPKMNLINCTQNKETKSCEKKLGLISLCQQSDLVITSFSPRETGVRIEKSFTAVLKPNAASADSIKITTATTPKSVYSTPKSILADNDDEAEDNGGSRDFIDFSTPATSKKLLPFGTRRALTKHSSMHLIDLTTPNKLAPASPRSRPRPGGATIATTIRNQTLPIDVKLATTPLAHTKLLRNKKEEEEVEGNHALPVTPSTPLEETQKQANVKNDLSTPLSAGSSASSVISVDVSTPYSSTPEVVIEISSEDSATPSSSSGIPNSPKHILSTKTPAKQLSSSTPQRAAPPSLMKRAILSSAKKNINTTKTPNRGPYTPIRNYKTNVTAAGGTAAGTSSSPITPRENRNIALSSQQRPYFTTPKVRRSLAVESKSSPHSTSSSLVVSSSSSTTLSSGKNAITTSTPLNAATTKRYFAASAPRSSLAATTASSSKRRISPLHGVRKSIGGVTLPSHISKTRRSMVSPTNQRKLSPTQIVTELVSKARKTLYGAQVYRSQKMAAAAVTGASARSRSILAAAMGASAEKGEKKAASEMTQERSTGTIKGKKEGDGGGDVGEREKATVKSPLSSSSVDKKDPDNLSSTFTLDDDDALDDTKTTSSKAKEERGIPAKNVTFSPNKKDTTQQNDAAESTKTPKQTVLNTTFSPKKSEATPVARELEKPTADVSESSAEVLESNDKKEAVETNEIAEDKAKNKVEEDADKDAIQKNNKVNNDTFDADDESKDNKKQLVEALDTSEVKMMKLASSEESVETELVNKANEEVLSLEKDTAATDTATVTATSSGESQGKEVTPQPNTSETMTNTENSEAEVVSPKDVSKAMEEFIEPLDDYEAADTDCLPSTSVSSKVIFSVKTDLVDDKTSIDVDSDVSDADAADSMKPEISSIATITTPSEFDVSSIGSECVVEKSIDGEVVGQESENFTGGSTKMDKGTDVKKISKDLDPETESKTSVVHIGETKHITADEKNTSSEAPSEAASGQPSADVEALTADIPKSAEIVLETENKSPEVTEGGKDAAEITVDEDSKVTTDSKEKGFCNIATNDNEVETMKETIVVESTTANTTNVDTIEGEYGDDKTSKETKASRKDKEVIVDTDTKSESESEYQSVPAVVEDKNDGGKSLSSDEEKENKRITATEIPSQRTTINTEGELTKSNPLEPKTPNLTGSRDMLRTPKQQHAEVTTTPQRYTNLRSNLMRTPKASTSAAAATAASVAAAMDDDADEVELIGLQTLLQTPKQSKKKTHLTPNVTTTTPRRSARRRASANADLQSSARCLTPSIDKKATDTTITTDFSITPQATTRRRSSASAELNYTPQRITRRRTSLSLDSEEEVATVLTPIKRSGGQRAKHIPTTTLLEGPPISEDMGVIIEEETKEEEVEEEVEGAQNDAQQKVEAVKNVKNLEMKSTDHSISEVIEESICEEVSTTQKEQVEAAADQAKSNNKTIAKSSPTRLEGGKKNLNLAEQEKDVATSTEDQRAQSVVVTVEESDNAEAKILDKSDYDYGKEVIQQENKEIHNVDDEQPKTPKTHRKSVRIAKDAMDSPKTPIMVGMRELMKTPKTAVDTPKLIGVSDLMRTPKVSVDLTLIDDDDEDDEGCLTGLADLVKTPKEMKGATSGNKGKKEEAAPSTSSEAQARSTFIGMRELLKTPKHTSTPHYRGMRELLRTPKACSTPQLGGIEELMQTPKSTKRNDKYEDNTVDDGGKNDDAERNEELDQFFKTPRAKNIMIPAEPASAILEPSSEASDLNILTATTEYDLHDSSQRALEDTYNKTPVSTRLTNVTEDDDDDDDDDGHGEEEVVAEESAKKPNKLDTIVTENDETDEAFVPETPALKRYLSAEELFDSLKGELTTLDITPPKKVYTPKRKTSMNVSLLSPFSATEVITDLPKPDIQEWVDNLQPTEEGELEERDEEREVTISASMIGDAATTHDPIAASMCEPNNITVMNKDTTEEMLADMSVVTTATTDDPLLSSALKETNPKDAGFNELKERLRPATPIDSEISGINLLDQTNESEFSEPLVVSDSESMHDDSQENDEITTAVEQRQEQQQQQQQQKSTESQSKTTESNTAGHKSQDEEEFPIMFVESSDSENEKEDEEALNVTRKTQISAHDNAQRDTPTPAHKEKDTEDEHEKTITANDQNDDGEQPLQQDTTAVINLDDSSSNSDAVESTTCPNSTTTTSTTSHSTTVTSDIHPEFRNFQAHRTIAHQQMRASTPNRIMPSTSRTQQAQLAREGRRRQSMGAEQHIVSVTIDLTQEKSRLVKEGRERGATENDVVVSRDAAECIIEVDESMDEEMVENGNANAKDVGESASSAQSTALGCNSAQSNEVTSSTTRTSDAKELHAEFANFQAHKTHSSTMSRGQRAATPDTHKFNQRQINPKTRARRLTVGAVQGQHLQNVTLNLVEFKLKLQQSKQQQPLNEQESVEESIQENDNDNVIAATECAVEVVVEVSDGEGGVEELEKTTKTKQAPENGGNVGDAEDALVENETLAVQLEIEADKNAEKEAAEEILGNIPTEKSSLEIVSNKPEIDQDINDDKAECSNVVKVLDGKMVEPVDNGNIDSKELATRPHSTTADEEEAATIETEIELPSVALDDSQAVAVAEKGEKEKTEFNASNIFDLTVASQNDSTAVNTTQGIIFDLTQGEEKEEWERAENAGEQKAKEKVNVDPEKVRKESAIHSNVAMLETAVPKTSTSEGRTNVEANKGQSEEDEICAAAVENCQEIPTIDLIKAVDESTKASAEAPKNDEGEAVGKIINNKNKEHSESEINEKPETAIPILEKQEQSASKKEDEPVKTDGELEISTNDAEAATTKVEAESSEKQEINTLAQQRAQLEAHDADTDNSVCEKENESTKSTTESPILLSQDSIIDLDSDVEEITENQTIPVTEDKDDIPSQILEEKSETQTGSTAEANEKVSNEEAANEAVQINEKEKPKAVYETVMQSEKSHPDTATTEEHEGNKAQKDSTTISIEIAADETELKAKAVGASTSSTLTTITTPQKQQPVRRSQPWTPTNIQFKRWMNKDKQLQNRRSSISVTNLNELEEKSQNSEAKRVQTQARRSSISSVTNLQELKGKQQNNEKEVLKTPTRRLSFSIFSESKLNDEKYKNEKVMQIQRRVSFSIENVDESKELYELKEKQQNNEKEMLKTPTRRSSFSLSKHQLNDEKDKNEKVLQMRRGVSFSFGNVGELKELDEIKEMDETKEVDEVVNLEKVENISGDVASTSMKMHERPLIQIAQEKDELPKESKILVEEPSSSSYDKETDKKENELIMQQDEEKIIENVEGACESVTPINEDEQPIEADSHKPADLEKDVSVELPANSEEVITISEDISEETPLVTKGVTADKGEATVVSEEVVEEMSSASEEASVVPEESPAISEGITAIPAEVPVPEESPAISEDITEIPEEAPVVPEKLAVSEETPVATEDLTADSVEAPGVSEELAIVTEETSVVAVEMATVSKEALVASEDALVVPEDLAVVSEGKPVVSEESAVISEQVTAVSEEAPVVSEETPVVTEVIKAVPEQVPGVPEKLAAVTEETSVASEDKPVVSKESSAIFEKVAAIPEEAPVLPEEPAVVSEETPVVTEDIKAIPEVVPEELATVTEETSVVSEDIPVSKESPTISKQVTATPEEAPVVLEELVVSEETHVVTEVIETVPEEVPGVPEKLATVTDEISVLSKDKPVVSEKSSAISKEVIVITKKTAITEEIAIVTEVTSVVSEDKPIDAEESPSMSKNITAVSEKTPKVSEKATVATEEESIVGKELAVVTDETSAGSEEIPVVLEETPIVSEDTLVVPGDSSVVPQHSLAISEAPVVPENSPAVPEEVTAISEEATVIPEFAAVPEKKSAISETTPAPEEISAASDETPVPENMVVISKETSVVPETLNFVPEKSAVVSEDTSAKPVEKLVATEEPPAASIPLKSEENADDKGTTSSVVKSQPVKRNKRKTSRSKQSEDENQETSSIKISKSEIIVEAPETEILKEDEAETVDTEDVVGQLNEETTTSDDKQPPAKRKTRPPSRTKKSAEEKIIETNLKETTNECETLIDQNSVVTADEEPNAETVTLTPITAEESVVEVEKPQPPIKRSTRKPSRSKQRTEETKRKVEADEEVESTTIVIVEEQGESANLDEQGVVEEENPVEETYMLPAKDGAESEQKVAEDVVVIVDEASTSEGNQQQPYKRKTRKPSRSKQVAEEKVAKVALDTELAAKDPEQFAKEPELIAKNSKIVEESEVAAQTKPTEELVTEQENTETAAEVKTTESSPSLHIKASFEVLLLTSDKTADTDKTVEGDVARSVAENNEQTSSKESEIELQSTITTEEETVSTRNTLTESKTETEIEAKAKAAEFATKSDKHAEEEEGHTQRQTRRTRKGSQSSQCSAQDEEHLATTTTTRRRGGRRRAETPTDHSADEAGAEHDAPTTTKRRRGHQAKLVAEVSNLEEIKEVILDEGSEQKQLDAEEEEKSVQQEPAIPPCPSLAGQPEEKVVEIMDPTTSSEVHCAEMEKETNKIAGEEEKSTSLKTVTAAEIADTNLDSPEVQEVSTEKEELTTHAAATTAPKRTRRKQTVSESSQTSSTAEPHTDVPHGTQRSRRRRKPTTEEPTSTLKIEEEIPEEKEAMNDEIAELQTPAEGIDGDDVNLNVAPLKTDMKKETEEEKKEISINKVVDVSESENVNDVKSEKEEEKITAAKVEEVKKKEVVASATTVRSARVSRRKKGETETAETEVEVDGSQKDGEATSKASEELTNSGIADSVGGRRGRRGAAAAATVAINEVAAAHKRGTPRSKSQQNKSQTIQSSNEEAKEIRGDKETAKAKPQNVVSKRRGGATAIADAHASPDEDVEEQHETDNDEAATATTSKRKVVSTRTRKRRESLHGTDEAHTANKASKARHEEEDTTSSALAESPTAVFTKSQQRSMRKRKNSPAEHAKVESAAGAYDGEEPQKKRPLSRKRRDSSLDSSIHEGSVDGAAAVAVDVADADAKAGGNTSSSSTATTPKRALPRRAVAAQEHNYDESSDAEAQIDLKRRIEKASLPKANTASSAGDATATTTSPSKHRSPKASNTHSTADEKTTETGSSTAEERSKLATSTPALAAAVTSRGRQRKPTARVQQYLEEERAKAETPKKRLLLSAVGGETPKSQSRATPAARRTRKASAVETEVNTAETAHTPARRRARGTQLQLLTRDTSEESRSEVEHQHSDTEITQSTTSSSRNTSDDVAAPAAKIAKRAPTRRGKQTTESSASEPTESELRDTTKKQEASAARAATPTSTQPTTVQQQGRSGRAAKAAAVAALVPDENPPGSHTKAARGGRARRGAHAYTTDENALEHDDTETKGNDREEAVATPSEEVAKGGKKTKATTTRGGRRNKQQQHDKEEQPEEDDAKASSSQQQQQKTLIIDADDEHEEDDDVELINYVEHGGDEEEDKPLTTVKSTKAAGAAAAKKRATGANASDAGIASKRTRRRAGAAEKSDDTESAAALAVAAGSRKVVRFDAAAAAASKSPAVTAAAAASVPATRATRSRRK